MARTRYRMRRCLLILLLALHVPAVFAWGNAGHRIVADLAWMQLTPQARVAASRLLALEPGATLASVSTWADDNRDDATRAWHFVNLPKDSCRYDAARDCPDGQCVIAAAERQLAVLGASGESDAQRLQALKYVVHLLADVHQPLHAGQFADRGGNRYQLQAFGEGTNLHALWDSGLLHRHRTSAAALAGASKAAAASATVVDLDLTRAAQESCRIVTTPGFYPPHTLPADYVERIAPVLEQRLVLAGARLAGWLNRVLP